MNSKILRRSAVPKCPFPQVDFKAADLSNALDAREFFLARA